MTRFNFYLHHIIFHPHFTTCHGDSHEHDEDDDNDWCSGHYPRVSRQWPYPYFILWEKCYPGYPCPHRPFHVVPVLLLQYIEHRGLVVEEIVRAVGNDFDPA